MISWLVVKSGLFPAFIYFFADSMCPTGITFMATPNHLCHLQWKCRAHCDVMLMTWGLSSVKRGSLNVNVVMLRVFSLSHWLVTQTNPLPGTLTFTCTGHLLHHLQPPAAGTANRLTHRKAFTPPPSPANTEQHLVRDVIHAHARTLTHTGIRRWYLGWQSRWRRERDPAAWSQSSCFLCRPEWS